MKHMVLALAIITLLLGNIQTLAQEDEPLNIMVSIVPYKYFVERIGSDLVEVDIMIPVGSDPHTYEPKPGQMKALSQTQVYFQIGIEFEQAWMERFQSANEDMLIIDLTANIEWLPNNEGHDEHHDEEHDEGHDEHHDEGHDEHHHGDHDEHIWTSPTLVKAQIEIIRDALIELDPDNEASYQANYEEFLADIEALDEEIRHKLDDIEQRQFMVFHPAWGYFAADYGLTQIPIESEGQEPSASELAQLIDTAKKEHIKVIFAQPEFSTAQAETIAQEIGGEVLLISPLEENWLENMQQIAETFAYALGQ